MKLPLLKVDFSSGFSADTGETLILILIVAGFVLLIFISGMLKPKKDKKKRYKRGSFRKAAHNAGLNTRQIKFLESMIKRYKISRPIALLSNAEKLDRYLKRALIDIDKSGSPPSERETLKLIAYRIKQILERITLGNRVNLTTHQLKPGQQLTLTTDGQIRYSTRVNGNIKEFFTTDLPFDQKGKQIKWRRGFKLSAYLWGNEGKEYNFDTRCLGYTRLREHPVMMLQHSEKVQEIRKRRFRRMTFSGPIYFYPVKIIRNGPKNEKQAVVQKKQGRFGKLQDISAGGCCIKTGNPLTAGSLVNLEFEIESGIQVNLFGKVLKMRKAKNPRESLLHILFTKGSSGNLNRINALIYGLGNIAGEEEPPDNS